MEFAPKKRLQLYAGRSHPELAHEVATHLGVPLGNPNLVDFASGEIRARFGESIRGSDVFILQTHSRPNEHIMEQLIMIDAAKRASAKRITAVCPYFGYARQDRKSDGREPISAKLMADMLTVAGADRVVSVDLHSGQIQGFFDIPVDHLFAAPVILEYLARNRGKVVSRSSIYEHLFDENDDSLSNLIDVHIFNLRRKLGHEFILTKRGHGYCIAE